MGTEVDARVSMRPDEVAAALGVGRDLVFKALKDGSLESFKLGRVRLVSVRALQRFVEAREQASA